MGNAHGHRKHREGRNEPAPPAFKYGTYAQLKQAQDPKQHGVLALRSRRLQPARPRRPGRGVRPARHRGAPRSPLPRHHLRRSA